MIRRSGPVSVVMAAILLPVAANAEEKPVYITGGAGYFDLRETGPGTEFRVDVLPGLRDWTYYPNANSFAESAPVTGPAASGLTSPGVSFGVEVPVSERFSFTPSFAVGDFGGVGSDDPAATEYRKGLALSYEFSNDWRLGAGIYHITEDRPDAASDGTGVITFSFTVPFGR